MCNINIFSTFFSNLDVKFQKAKFQKNIIKKRNYNKKSSKQLKCFIQQHSLGCNKKRNENGKKIEEEI